MESLKLGSIAQRELAKTRGLIQVSRRSYARGKADCSALQAFQSMDDRPASLADFDKMMAIGKGGMGKIFMVKKKVSGEVYAMKVQGVAALIKSNLLDRARNEMKILISLHHPFLVRLHYCFVDNNQLCMILDFCPGGAKPKPALTATSTLMFVAGVFFHFSRKLKVCTSAAPSMCLEVRNCGSYEFCAASEPQAFAHRCRVLHSRGPCNQSN